MSNTVGELLFKIGADVASLKTDMNSARRTVDEAAGQMSGALDKVGTVLKGLPILYAANLLKEKFSESVSVLGDLSEAAQRTGTSARELSGMLAAAAASGMGLEGIVTLTDRLTMSMTKSEKETSAAAAAFKALNIDPTKFSSAAELQRALAESINQYSDGLQKNQLITAIAGKQASQFIDYLKELQSREASVIVTTDEAANSAKRLGDEWAVLKSESAILTANAFGPLIKSVGEMIAGFNRAREAGVGFFQAMMEAPGVGGIGASPEQLVMQQEKALNDAIAKRDRVQKEYDKQLANARNNPMAVNKFIEADLDKRVADVNRARDALQRALDGLRASQTPGSWLDQPGVKKPAPSAVPEGTNKGTDWASQAREYLNALEKVGEGYKDMTHEEQVLFDLSHGRTAELAKHVPTLQQSAIAAAKIADEKEREAMSDKAIAASVLEALKADQDRIDVLNNEKSAAELNTEELATILANIPIRRQAHMQELQDLLDTKMMIGEITDAEHEQAMARIHGLEKAKDKAKESTDDLKKAIEGFGRSTSKAFADMLFGGSGSWSELIKQFGKEVIEQYLYKEVFGKLFDMLAKSTNFGSFGNIGTAIMKGFGGSATSGTMVGDAAAAGIGGGGMADGGPVMAGQSYLVGERGPEVLTMGANGMITPYGGGGGGVKISNTYNIDARADRGAIIKEIERATRVSEARISDMIQRGNRGFTR